MAGGGLSGPWGGVCVMVHMPRQANNQVGSRSDIVFKFACKHSLSSMLAVLQTTSIQDGYTLIATLCREKFRLQILGSY